MSQRDVEQKQSGDSDRPSTQWEMIRRRLKTVQETLEHESTPTVEEEKAILKARAKAMAQVPVGAQDDIVEREIVLFRLAHETYGLESCHIREIYPLREFTPLPCTPSFVMGLVNVRGHLISILDLKRFFDLRVEQLDSNSQIIILQNNEMEFGVLADGLLGVQQITLESLQPSLPTLTGVRQEFLLGITAERAIILDAAKLLSSREIVVYEEVEI